MNDNNKNQLTFQARLVRLLRECGLVGRVRNAECCEVVEGDGGRSGDVVALGVVDAQGAEQAQRVGVAG